MPRAVVTGGAGFIGSHLCRALRGRDWEVVAVDNLSTGRRAHVTEHDGDPGFRLLEHDVTVPFDVAGPVDAVLHLASPASPPDYLALPVETLEAGSSGTRHTLELAAAKGARYLLASTSEVYGDPQVHPQPESYWGHVNPVGPRSVYDEAKRFAEALVTAHRHTRGIDTRVARIFNTYGPGLRPGDGRAIPNFLAQALSGEPLTVYGDGTQTRSFCYVDDEIGGILALLDAAPGDWSAGPVNIGNPDEVSVADLAALVLEVTGSASPIVFAPLPTDDPGRRCPDISRAEALLGWRPEVSLREGLTRTARWLEGVLAK